MKMLNAKAFANAMTIVTAVFYVACIMLSYVAPDILFSTAQSWTHSLNLSVLKTNNQISLTSTLWGLLTINLLTWTTTYATIWLYNKLAKS